MASGEGRKNGAHKGENLFRAGDVGPQWPLWLPSLLLSLRQTEINNKRHHHEEGCLERCRRTELFARRTMMISQPSMILTSMGQS